MARNELVKNCTGQNLIRLAARVIPASRPVSHPIIPDLSVLSLWHRVGLDHCHPIGLDHCH